MITGDEALYWAKKLLGEQGADLITKINQVEDFVEDINTHSVHYGWCYTWSSDQEKIATVPGITNYFDGLHLRINFTFPQSYNGVPLLNVNSIGAKEIHLNQLDRAGDGEWRSGSIIDLIYYDNKFLIVNGEHASAYYWGKTILSSSTSSTSETEAATPKAVKEAYDLADSKLSPTDLNLFDVVTPSFSSLPKTFYSPKITANCKLVSNAIELSTPKAGDINWNIVFADGSLTISGTFHGSTATTAKMSIWIPTDTITLTNS